MELRNRKTGDTVELFLWTDRKKRVCVRYTHSAASAVWRETIYARHPGMWEVTRYAYDEGLALLRSGVVPRPSRHCQAERVCAVCGCHDLLGCEGGCHWVDDALCSSCLKVPHGPEDAR